MLPYFWQKCGLHTVTFGDMHTDVFKVRAADSVKFMFETTSSIGVSSICLLAMLIFETIIDTRHVVTTPADFVKL